MSARLAPYIIALAAVLPEAIVWRNYNIYQVGWFLLVVSVVAWWWFWEPGDKFRNVTWPLLPLIGLWFSAWLFFLLLDNDIWRFIFIALEFAGSWWYMTAWLRNKSHILGVIRGAGLVPTVMMSWIILFFLGTAGSAWFILLGTKVSLIMSIYTVVLILLLMAIWWVAAWPVRETGLYALVLWLVQLETFIVTLWLSSSFYLLGWLQASVWLGLFLLIWHDMGLTLSRRTLVRYIIAIIAASVVLLLSARWF